MENLLMTALLTRFPKRRPELPEVYQRIYAQELGAGRAGQNWIHRLVLWAEGWMHRIIEQPERSGSVLELGAGILNHLPYTKQAECYDIVEPNTHMLARANPTDLQRVRHCHQDIAEIDPDMRFDRILSVAVLEHLEQLPLVVARSALLLKPEGIFQAGVPSEGSLLWHLGSTLTTGISFRLRTGLSYTPLIRYEHINTATEIEQVIHHFFERVSIRRFPLPWLHTSLYTCLEARIPKLEKCKQFLSTTAPDKENSST